MKNLTCIVCPRGCRLTVDEAHDYAVTGNGCPRGVEYGRIELTNPTRVVTSTVRCVGGVHPRCPVKTDRPIPKALVRSAAAALDGVTVTAPAEPGRVVLRDVCGTGASFVTTRAI